MSPEQHRGVDYSFDADWWALGVMLYLMLTGRLPFAANASTPAEIAFSVALEPVQFDKSDSQIDEHSKSLIRGLLVKDRRKRLCDPFRMLIQFTDR
ncbi:kinase-like domain-containing protein [Flagelloscypha sp. PMI_526]|nr:kinase-like domain-containing protein [Flagelloscypha sp. PMI_526]